MSAFDSSITEAQQNGTLEAMLVTETPLTMILIASTAYPFVLLAMRTVIYLAWGVLFFHFPIHEANWLGAVMILIVSILAFAGLGIISTSYLLLFKRGNPASWLIVGASSLLGGMMYPVSVLPGRLCNGWRDCFRSLTHWKECGRRCWQAPPSRNSGRQCARCSFSPWFCCRFQAWSLPGRCAAPRSPAPSRICDR